MNRTPWFPGDVKPVRVGVYEREHKFALAFSYWDGRQWCGVSWSPDLASDWRTYKSDYQHLPWRGLTKEAK